VVPAIRGLRESFEQTAATEVQRFLKRTKPDAAEAEEVQRMVRRILNKLLHAPSHTLRKFSGRDDQPLLLEFLHELHDLSTAPAAAEPIRKQHLSLVKG
jgi:glutamyl-tRNA reductase